MRLVNLSTILSSWKNFPRRDLGIICSTDPGRSRSYGEVFIMIPFDNTKIGICSDEDLWDSFPYLKQTYGIESISEIKWFLNEVNISEMNIDKIKTITIGDLYKIYSSKSFFDTIGALYSKNLLKYISNPTNSYITIKEWLEDALDPIKNKFKTGTAAWKLPSQSEVWFDGSCVAIPLNELNQIKQIII